MRGCTEHLRHWPQLDDAAQIHDGHAVTEVLHHRQIVADEDAGQIKIAVQFKEQIDDLRLNRHVQRGDRFVADQYVGLHGQRTGNRDTLPLTA